MTRTVTVDEASQYFNQLLAEVIADADEIIIARDGTPVARLTPVAAIPRQRIPGYDAGKFVVSEEFFAPLPDDIVEEFYK